MIEAAPIQIALSTDVKRRVGRDDVDKDHPLFERAQEFESVFIAEMLKYSGFSEALSNEAGFGGEAFSSMLLERYAEDIVQSGGFGLAEHIYAQLMDREAQHATDASA